MVHLPPSGCLEEEAFSPFLSPLVLVREDGEGV